MNRLRRKSFWIGLLLGAQAALASFAADLPNPSALSPMPPVRSPIEYFRELLAMNPAERRNSLTNRPLESQRRILAKVREYESLQPEECKLRLEVTELHYYLVQLLGTPATNRPAQLKLIPKETLKLVEDRLEEWDSLPGELKQRLLENEAMLDYFTRRAVSLPPTPGHPSEAMPASDREKLNESLRRWQSLTPEERASVLKHFRRVFDITPEEKTNILATLSDPERHQVERTLQTFANLTPSQKARCIRSFEKFASLSPEDRQQFLKDASRWEVMTPSQRQTWRDLVYNLSHGPPLPPGIDGPPKPPLPHQPQLRSALLTNTN
jgi:hypothetical protein